MNETLRWTATDPQGRQIALKLSTYDGHIKYDHTPEDSSYRAINEQLARNTLQKPRFIFNDPASRGRMDYIDIVKTATDDGRMKFKLMKVVVDTDRVPHEVVTWILQRKLSDVVPEEEIIYDSERQTGQQL